MHIEIENFTNCWKKLIKELINDYRKNYPAVKDRELRIINCPSIEKPDYNQKGLNYIRKDIDTIRLSILYPTKEQIIFQLFHELTHWRINSNTNYYIVSSEEESECFDESINWLYKYSYFEYSNDRINDILSNDKEKNKYKYSNYLNLKEN